MGERNPEHAPKKEPEPRKTVDPDTARKLGKVANDGARK
jgi:hypothetical protein